jgi:hypothetical protein
MAWSAGNSVVAASSAGQRIVLVLYVRHLGGHLATQVDTTPWRPPLYHSIARPTPDHAAQAHPSHRRRHAKPTSCAQRRPRFAAPHGAMQRPRVDAPGHANTAQRTGCARTGAFAARQGPSKAARRPLVAAAAAGPSGEDCNASSSGRCEPLTSQAAALQPLRLQPLRLQPLRPAGQLVHQLRLGHRTSRRHAALLSVALPASGAVAIAAPHQPASPRRTASPYVAVRSQVCFPPCAAAVVSARAALAEPAAVAAAPSAPSFLQPLLPSPPADLLAQLEGRTAIYQPG